MLNFNTIIKRRIDLSGEALEYEIKRSHRAKILRLIIYPTGKVVAILPLMATERAATDFIWQKREWVLKRLRLLKENCGAAVFVVSRREYQKYREAAFNLALQRLELLNQIYNLQYQRISIRCQKTRWGSCSRKGNLNFNYKIALMPERFVNYIIAHELCHLAEFNHSPRFWALVAKAVPDYKNVRRKLRQGEFVEV